MILIKIGGGKKINLDYICEDIKILIDQQEKKLFSFMVPVLPVMKSLKKWGHQPKR